MSLTSKEGGSSNIEPVPQGTHKAVCCGIYDIGSQHSQVYDKWNDSVIISWQIPLIRIQIEEEDLPRLLTFTYTNTLGERANLRKLLEGWRGRAFTPKELEGFDLSKVLGVSCIMQIIHKNGKGANANKTYANIQSITRRSFTSFAHASPAAPVPLGVKPYRSP